MDNRYKELVNKARFSRNANDDFLVEDIDELLQ